MNTKPTFASGIATIALGIACALPMVIYFGTSSPLNPKRPAPEVVRNVLGVDAQTDLSYVTLQDASAANISDVTMADPPIKHGK